MMIALGWFFLLTSIIVGYFLLLHYRQNHHHSFRWQNQFPYELPQNRYFQIPSFLIVVVVLIAGVAVGYFSMLLSLLYLPIYQILGILFLTWMLSFLILFWIRPRQSNWFLILHLLPITLLSLFYFYATYAFYSGPFEQFRFFLPYTSFVQGIVQLLLLMNPRLKTWYQLERIEETNKKPRVQRPTWFVLAYTTWFTLLNGIVWLVLLQLEMLIG